MQITRPNLSVAVDWLQFTLRGVPVSDVERVLGGVVQGDFVTATGGQLGYERMRVHSAGAVVLTSARREKAGEVHCRLPGRFCSAVGVVGMRRLLRWLGQGGATVTRLDLACDDYAHCASPASVREAVTAGEAVTHTQRWQWHEGDDGGSTFYVGSAQSEVRLRVYDKLIESGGEIDAVRWELQLRDNAATALARAMVENENWGEVFAARLVAFVDFRVRGADVNVSRCPRRGWFVELVGGAVRARYQLPVNPMATVSEVRDFIDRQVAPLLSAVVAADGGAVDWLYELLESGRKRWRVKHRLLAKQSA